MTGVNRLNLVALLYWKLKNTKTDLLDLHLIQLNVNEIWVSFACLLPQTILTSSLWSQSLRTCGLPLHCPSYTILRDIKCPYNFINGMSYSFSIHYHALFKLIIHVALSWSELASFYTKSLDVKIWCHLKFHTVSPWLLAFQVMWIFIDPI